MPDRFRVALIASLTVISSLMAAAPAGAAVTPQKVVIIVGPTGALTDNYRSKGDAIAAAAEAAGATAVKVYSPNATWANVKAAVNGANIVVYLGHGNGYPNPYGSTELTDRHNGWGLNRTTTNGDGDNWGSTMVYCGEKALRGMLTSSDDSARLTYCGGTANDGITPAPNWVMIYSNACYTPGAGEGWDTPATESVALERVRNFSYPALALGAGAYFASDMHQGSQQLVDTILRNPGMAFGAIAENANGYDLSRQRHFSHQDLTSNRIWIQNTGDPTSGDYFFAYAGRPALTPSGTTVAYTEPPSAPPPGATTYSPPATLIFKAGSHIGYQFSGSGAVTASLPYTLPFDSSASTDTRTTISGQSGYWFRVTNGIWAGYWLRESSMLYLQSAPPAPPPGATTYSPPATLIFKAGSHIGYQFSGSGAVTASLPYTLPFDSSASTDTRTTISGQSGYWFRVTNGIWAGYWLRESSMLYLQSAPPAPPPGATTYSPPATLIFKAGSHIGYQFSGSGAVTASLPYTLPFDSSASTDTRTTISGQSGYWFRVTNGIWAGYWLRESSMLYLQSAPPAPPPGATTYSPPATLIFKAGSHIGYQFSGSGAVTASLPYTLPFDSSASTDTRTTISGQSGYWFRVTNGIWAGYWLRESSMLYLASG